MNIILEKHRKIFKQDVQNALMVMVLNGQKNLNDLQKASTARMVNIGS